MTSINEFSETTINSDPFIQFKIWYDEHQGAGIEIPDSVSLATATSDGHVSLRTVLLKSYDENGFVFFTNYKSKKGTQLISNPRAAMLFYWPESGRQVRLEGSTQKIPKGESEDYFSIRPKESQLSAWASEQSSVIADRQFLENRFQFYKNLYAEKPMEKPEHWGGFRLVPDWFEFWQNGEFRLHDRLTYTRKKAGWVVERLAP